MPREQRGCLAGWLAGLLGGQAAPAGGAAVAKVIINKMFVSDAEASFFRLLRSVVGARGHVLAQVSLGQLLWFPPRQERGLVQRWRNKVSQKSIDFVVCDPATLRPLVAIELDEPSHATPKRQSRDEDVETILEAAGLPLLHVLASRTYDTRELETTLAPHLTGRT